MRQLVGATLRRAITAGGAITPPGLLPHPTFTFDGVPLQHFVHRYNVGYPPFRMTERSIELAVADLYLNSHNNNVVEVGAVSPYYWPNRIATIVDPTDPHSAVSNRCRWSDWRVDERPIVSVSTFEHIGTGDYGIETDIAVREAIDKLFLSGSDFLVTFPPGYNRELDAYLASLDLASHNVHGFGWSRGLRGNDWREVTLPDLLRSLPTYGTTTGATALAILIRTPNLDWLLA